jgi:hypothetical protein
MAQKEDETMPGKFIAAGLALIVLTASGSSELIAQKGLAAQPQVVQNNVAVKDLVSRGMVAYRNKDFAESAKLLQEAVTRGARDKGVLYDTACSTALAGDKEKAFDYLLRAIKAGFRNTAHLKTDDDLISLHGDPRWSQALATSDRQQDKYLKEHGDPDKARFITTDVARFWRVYDKAKAAASHDERVRILQQEYIDPGTIGLQDFASSGRLNAEGLAQKIEKYSNFFGAIRLLTLGIESQRAETLAAFRKFKEIYPQTIFPDIYFILGQMRSGGTASDNGLLMGAEMFTSSPSLPTTELNGWEKGAIMRQGEIPPLVAHELVHFQQVFPADKSLLCVSLKEGSADFIGELVSGRMIDRMKETHRWANARERELWEAFQKEMDGTDISHWLYGSSGGADRPVDLGYWMGYKISEAYYKNSADKKRAIKETLLMGSCKEYLKASRYAEKFSSQ